MTITNSNSRIAYTGNGVTVAFSFPYAFDSQDDLVVILTVTTTGVETVQTITTHYTISGTVDSLGRYPTGGTITFVTAPPSTVSATIYRDPEALQELDLPGNGLLPAEPLEAELDYLTMLAQRTRDIADRSVQLADGETSTDAKTVLPFDRASKYLAFGSGKELVAVDAATASGTSVLATGSTTARLLANRAADWLNVLDYGADKTGVADSTAALQAVALICDGKAVFFPSGTYKVTDTILWAAQHTSLVGSGPNTTLINFQPTTTGKACFKFNAVNPPYNIQVFCGIQNMKFSASGNTQAGKVMLQIITNEEFWMDNFRIEGCFDATDSCIGIEHHGWQLNHFRNGHIYANLPLSLRLNPWTLPIFLDLDDCYFENLILAPRNGDGTLTSTVHYGVKIEDGAFITNSSFRNCHWVGGIGGIIWDDIPRTITNVADNGTGSCRITTSGAHTFDAERYVSITGIVGTLEANTRAVATSITDTTFDLDDVPFVHAYTSGGVAYRSPGNSYGLVFDNCRGESHSTGWMYHFNRQGSPIDSIEFRTQYMSSLCDGIYLRRVRHAQFTGVQFTAGSNKFALDFQGEAQCSFDLLNCLFSTGGGKVKIPGFRQTWAAAKPASVAILPNTGHYDYDTLDSSARLTLDSVGRRSFQGTLVDQELMDLQCGSGVNTTQALIAVTVHGLTKDEGMTCFASTGKDVFKIAGTANTAVADTAANLCVYRTTSNIKLRNRLGETVDYLVTLDERNSMDITATNLNATDLYTLGTTLNLTDIVITDAVATVAGTAIVAQISTTSAQAGRLSTATAGATTSTYDEGLQNGNGIWIADGIVADVNTLLAGLTFTPHPDVTITGCANNGSGVVRVTAPGHGYTSSQTFTIINVVGTTEANVSKVAMTYVNANAFDIASVPFVNPYVSGGTMRYAGTIAFRVQIYNSKNQTVQGRKAIGPV